MRNLVKLLNTTHRLIGVFSISVLLLSTSALAFPVSPPVNVEGIRPAEGATIPASPDIWIALSSGEGDVITGRFVDENGTVVANATVSEPSSLAKFRKQVMSVTADEPLPVGTMVALVLQIPFGRFEEVDFIYNVEQTPRPSVVLPSLQVSEIEVFFANGEIRVQFTATIDEDDLPADVQGFIVGGSVDVGESASGDRLRTSLVVFAHPELEGLRQGVHRTLTEILEDEKPTEVCVSLGAHTVSNIEIPPSFVQAEMDCHPIELEDAVWDALVAKREADRIIQTAEPDPLPPAGFGCSQSGAANTAPFILLGLLGLRIAARRRRGCAGV